ncbi:MAG: RimK family alpha-L-glutamate ligase [Planctomycetales bacterium]|nr:RimK family alpha-L-glutamate ligase [Planctomycetales bacterium]
MRIAVLSDAQSWYYRDLLRAAGESHQLQAVSFARLSASLCEGRGKVTSDGIGLVDFDALIVRSMPPGSLEQVVFRMDVLGRLAASGMCVVNPPRALEAAVDKFLATALLAEAGLKTPPTVACQSVPEALEAWERSGGDVVVKPIFGSEGRGMIRVSDPAIAERTFKALARLDAVLYLQQFVPHDGSDVRLFVAGQQVWGMRRRHASDWRTNISCGGRGEPFEVTDAWAELARRAAAAVGASIAGVDFLIGLDGETYALEVNGVPGWKALAETTGVDIAAQVLEHVAQLSRRAA